MKTSQKPLRKKSGRKQSKMPTIQKPLKSVLSDTRLRLTFRKSLESLGGHMIQKHEPKISNTNGLIQFSFAPKDAG